MYSGTSTATRSATTTCTASRVEAVLDLFLGDVVAFIARGLVTQDRAVGWLRDLRDILLLEAVERFQLKLTLPDGSERALDYEVSDDGRIGSSDGCGGFSSYWIPANSSIRLIVQWRADAPNYAEAHRLLQSRGWGPAKMLGGSSTSDRTLSNDGYGLRRRTIGDWEV